VEHCSGMQVAPAQRHGEVRGGTAYRQTLCQSRNDCSRITASDAQPLAACITQLTIEYVQRRGQPRPASPASRGEKCGVKHEERQHRLSVVDRRTQRGIVIQSKIAPYPPDRRAPVRTHRLILHRASWVFRTFQRDAGVKTIGET
jgi:hypothetical protein